MIDAMSGEIELGPAVRLADGSLRNYGAVRPKGSSCACPSYRSGGGARGNVAPHAVRAEGIDPVHRAASRTASPATAASTVRIVESAKIRGPILCAHVTARSRRRTTNTLRARQRRRSRASVP